MIALVTAASVACLIWPNWSQREYARAFAREESRTHDRPLDPRNIVESGAIEALAPIRGPQNGSAEVLSFVSMPSFSPWRAVSISLLPGDVVARGRTVGIQRSVTGDGISLRFSNERTFAVPRAAFLQAALKLDRLTDGWPGSEAGVGTDGTPVAFERIKPGKVISGTGSGSSDEHYAVVQEVVEALLRQYAPISESVSFATRLRSK